MFTPHPKRSLSFDVVLVGGGLANGLIALSLLSRRPDLSLCLVEAETHIGGNHTWSFHPSDVGADARPFVDRLVEHRWPGYTVAFPHSERRLDHEYACFTGARLDAVLRRHFEESPSSALILGRRAYGISEHAVMLEDGCVLRAELVVDGRGPEHLGRTNSCRYQKFLGLELQLRHPSPVREPVLMDARVPQTDGFRFVYVLPFEERRVLIEDTYFADDTALDETTLEARVLDYASRHGFDVAEVLRRERGVLPLPITHPEPGRRHGPLISGYHGGWFHPTTGYSFPAAVRVAEFAASKNPSSFFDADFDALVGSVRRQQRFLTMLNRLLYGAFAPEQRFNVLERFYQLPSDTISRFYAMQTTATDRARIICGRPPRGLSLKRALLQTSTT